MSTATISRPAGADAGAAHLSEDSAVSLAAAYAAADPAGARRHLIDHIAAEATRIVMEECNWRSAPTPLEVAAYASSVKPGLDLHGPDMYGHWLGYHSDVAVEVFYIESLERVIPDAGITRSQRLREHLDNGHLDFASNLVRGAIRSSLKKTVETLLDPAYQPTVEAVVVPAPARTRRKKAPARSYPKRTAPRTPSKAATGPAAPPVANAPVVPSGPLIGGIPGLFDWDN